MADLKERIERLNPDQVGRFNKSCIAKIHSKAEGDLITEQKQESDDLSDQVNNLPREEFDTLQASMNEDNQLSGWPC